ncbi:TGc domain-containing protein, partial [Haematococcus lacustris]
MCSANDSPERDPASWEVLGRRVGTGQEGGEWVKLDDQADVGFTSRHQLRTFRLEDTQHSTGQAGWRRQQQQGAYEGS